MRTGILQNFNLNSMGTLYGRIQGYRFDYKFDQQTIVAHGYLFAQTAGTYTFAANNINDEILVFTGANALGNQPFSRNIADIDAGRFNGANGAPTSDRQAYTLEAGQALAFTVIYVNGVGSGFGGFTVTTPGGTTTDTTGLFVQHCLPSEFTAPTGTACNDLPPGQQDRSGSGEDGDSDADSCPP